MRFYTGCWEYRLPSLDSNLKKYGFSQGVGREVRNSLFHIGYDDGKRFMDQHHYEPYMFVENPARPSGFHSIDGKVLQRIEFPDMGAQRKYIWEHKDISNHKIYGSPNFQFVYLNDEYPGVVDYDMSLIKVINIDIEVAADEGFPSPDEHAKPVTAITMKYGDRIIVFGCGDYEPNVEYNVEYHKCRDEEDLLSRFVDSWAAIDPDVVTGWNIEHFDIPYIVYRTAKIVGAYKAAQLSPFGLIGARKFNMRQWGEKPLQVERPDIIGVNCLDYITLYRKFTYTQQESYSLDNISAVELGEKKLDYSEYDGLLSLYKNDYQKFIEYNIRDVELVDKLDKKLGLIDLIFAIAYDGKVNAVDAFTSVRMWDILVHNYLHAKQIAIPPLNIREKERQVEGAYVKEPQTGLHNWVMSFDLNSLYPHLIMQYNIGPETHVGSFPKQLLLPKANLHVDHIMDGVLDEKPELKQYLKDHNLTCTGAGELYTRDFRSFMASLMEKMYNDRVVFKNRMNELKQEQEDTGKDLSADIAKADNMQMAKKIQLNSAYGALGNEFFRWFDIRYAESITLSGQLSIRWMEKHINEYLNKTLDTNEVDYVIACDTDSMYITLDRLVEKTFENKEAKRDDILRWMDLVAGKVFEPFIDKTFTKLAKHVNAYEQKMFMKREAIADKGIWTAKKRYALHVYDMEGVRYKEPIMKVMGLETQRSSVPLICRDNMKAALRLIFEKDEKALMEFVANFRNKFKSLSFEDVAFPRGVKGLDKYKNEVTIYNKGTPIHVRGALVFNNMLKEHDIEQQYNPIYEGDKIKFCYLKLPNPARENVLAINSALPKQFNIAQYIDYEKQFEKSFLEPMKNIAETIQWRLERGQATLEDFF